MITVSVFYPRKDGSKFDMDYYVNSHMPMVQQKLGAACKGMSIERGLAGGAPGSQPTYVAMVHLRFDSVQSFQNAFGPQAVRLEEVLQRGQIGSCRFADHLNSLPRQHLVQPQSGLAVRRQCQARDHGTHLAYPECEV